MKIYYEYTGKDFNVTSEDMYADYIQFESNNTEYIIDIAGEHDFCIEKNAIYGRIKVQECEMLQPEIKEIESEEELKELLLNMDKSSFILGLFEDDREPDYSKLEIEIYVDNAEINISKEK